MTQLDLIELAGEQLIKESAMLKKLEKLKSVERPAGSLRVVHGKKHDLYLHRNYDGESARTLDATKPRDLRVIRRLAEKSLIRIGHPRLQKNVRALQQFLRAYNIHDPRKYPNGGLVGDEFCLPGETDWLRWIEETEHGQYQTNPSYPENKVYRTINGELVRSKSEVMIADYYRSMGWCYRCDAALDVLGRMHYPDFQFMHPTHNNLVIHEHFGMLHHQDYVANSYRKIENYAKAGFKIGKNLIITWETEKEPLTLDKVKEALRSAGISPD